MRLWLFVGALATVPLATVAAAQAVPTEDASWGVDPRPGTPVEDPDAVADLGGARLYLETQIRPRDPDRYVLLDPALSRLEAMNEIAEGVTWTSMATTAATLAIAVGLAADQQKEPAAVLFTVSGGVLLLGLLVQAVFRPSREAVLDVFRVSR